MFSHVNTIIQSDTGNTLVAKMFVFQNSLHLIFAKYIIEVYLFVKINSSKYYFSPKLIRTQIDVVNLAIDYLNTSWGFVKNSALGIGSHSWPKR